jgi:GT2 family glycosyltransferase
MTPSSVTPHDTDVLITVVVCVRDDRRIYRTIGSLLEQTTSSDAYEIIVVENGSTLFADVTNLDGNMVRYFNIRNPNVAAARNVGLRAARGRFLLMTDADCIAAPDWIEQMTNALACDSCAALGGAIRKYQPRSATQRHGITLVDGQHRLNYLPALPLPYVVSANVGFITSLVREVGGFDTSFRSGEDVDVCYRLGLFGYRVGLARGAVIWHEDRRSIADHFRRFRHYAEYQVLLYGKYKHISGRRFVLNPYPAARLLQVTLAAPRAFVQALRGDYALASQLFLQSVEAAGVWCGDLFGSLRYRQLYL